MGTRYTMPFTAEDIEKAKKRESYIASEFYRVVKNTLRNISYPQANWVVEDVLAEVPVNEDKADLVIAGRQYGRVRVLLVVECKQRPFTTLGRSYAAAARQAFHYAQKLDSRFFAIYDGWLLQVFQSSDPYLIGVYNAELGKELTENFVINLQTGLLEFEYTNRTEILDRLPKARDPELLKKKVMPFLAKSFARQDFERARSQGIAMDIDRRADELLNKWKTQA